MWRTFRTITSLLALSVGLIAQFQQAPGSPFPSKMNPAAIAVGDFNGDLIPDLAIANADSNNVTIYLGDGTGSFTLAVNSPFPAGTTPSSLVAGDFNNDGNLDLAVANLNSQSVTILLGDGTGNFAAPPSSPITTGVGRLPSAIVAGNFNVTNNQNLDLAVANKLDNTVTILLGNGDGTFSTAGSVINLGSLATGPSAITPFQFHTNQPKEQTNLAVVNLESNNVSILLGNGMGGFTQPAQSPYSVPLPPGAPPNQLPDPISVKAADFNGDAALDLAIANENNNTVTVLLGDGMGGFGMQALGSPFPVGSEPVSVAASDFNNDGNQDLAVVNYRDGTVSILLGNGDVASSPVGTLQFTAAPGSPFSIGGSLPHFVAIGDFKLDGRPDLAIANEESNNVSVLMNAIYSPSMVSSADGTTTVAPGSIVSIYGNGIASSMATASLPLPSSPLPTSLGGASVTFTDSSKTQSSLGLFYASPTQINAQIPPMAASGTATFSIYSGSMPQTGTVTVAAIAPGLFSANQTGKGVALAQYVVTLPTGFQNVTDTFQCPGGAGTCVTVPINVSMNPGFLVLYGTGITSEAAGATVNITGQTIGSPTVPLPASYAGPSSMMSVDQVNVMLPSSLAGTGVANVSIQFKPAGSTTPVTSNVVTIYIQ